MKLYRSGAVTGTGLEQYLNMTVEIGTGTVAWPDCTGFTPGSTIYATNTMSNFMSTYTDWNSGLATWTPSAGNQSRVFRITLSLQDNNAAQGKDVTFGFTWEAQIS